MKTITKMNIGRGFTLIELIVSVSLFTIVVTIAMSAYVSLIALDRKARATNELVSNLSFAVNTMSRSIRTGTTYQNDSSSFGYIDENCEYVTYLRKTNGNSHSIGECVSQPDISGACNPTPSVCTDISAIPLTDSRIDVTNMKFYSRGIGTGDGQQPSVIFTVTGTLKADANSQPITFTIESGATQRLIDL